MRKLFIIAHLIFCLIYKKSNAQINWIPNPSFEDSVGCSTLDLPVLNWFSASLSPDCFSSLYYGYCWAVGNVPINPAGYQYAYHGNSYLGFNAYYPGMPDSREWIQAQLMDSLIINKKYCASFNVNLINNCQRATDDIGAYFSDTTIESYGPPLFEFPSQVNNPQGNFITDTANWTLISGIFTAAGGEKYITIGNFKNDANTTVVIYNPSSPNQETYYLIDMVSLVQLPDIDAGINDSINLGDSSQLIGTCTGCWAGLGYQWYPSTGLNDSTIINPLATPGQTTTYYFGLVDTTGTIPCMVDYVDSVTVYVCCVGVEEMNDKNDFGIIYPNPANTIAYYEIELENAQTGFVTLFDVLGNLVASQKLNSGKNKAEFDLNNISNGVYVYKLSIDNEFKTSNKLIIAR